MKAVMEDIVFLRWYGPWNMNKWVNDLRMVCYRGQSWGIMFSGSQEAPWKPMAFVCITGSHASPASQTICSKWGKWHAMTWAQLKECVRVLERKASQEAKCQKLLQTHLLTTAALLLPLQRPQASTWKVTKPKLLWQHLPLAPRGESFLGA